MENQIQSREVGCCGARTWSLVIGWLQTIGSGLYLAVTFDSFLKLSNVYDFFKGVETKVEQEDVSKAEKEAVLSFVNIMGLELVVFVATLIKLTIEFVSGIILILGVKQQNAGKVRIWHIVQIIFLVISVPVAVFLITDKKYDEVVPVIISILCTIFCMWVVNIHRQELTNAFPREGSRKI